MKNIYSVICGKFRKFKNSKILYIFEKTLVLSTICSKYKNEDGKIYKKIINWNIKNSRFNQKYIITLKYT